VSNEQQAQQADDPSGPGWRWVRQGETLELHDMMQAEGEWWPTKNAGETCSKEGMYRRRIEQQQPSDSEPETMEELRKQVATFRHLAEMSRRQVADEAGKIERLKEQVQTLTRERDRYQAWLQQHHTTGQQSAVKKLERWLRPVVKVVSDHPDNTSILAVSVMEFLPQIASRLIEE
jgi:hypothetical protein